MRWLPALALLLSGLPVRGMDWKFVEVELSLRPDGKATVVYRVAIDPQGASLHGFYFQGYTGQPDFDMAQCYALGPDGTRYGLDIRDLGGKFDILLAGGRAVSRGQVVYVLTFGTDLAASGNLARTSSPEHGEFVVLNWSPVQWNQRLGHYTLKIFWPVAVGGPQVTAEDLARLRLRTERFMNDSYKMDYFGTEFHGKHWLTQRIHWENVPPRGQLRVQEYVDPAVVPLVTRPAAMMPQPVEQTAEPVRTLPPPAARRLPAPPPPAKPAVPDGVLLFGMAVVLGLLFVAVITAKHRSMLAAADGLKDVSWLDADWTPPQIVLSSFRKTGKIPDLEPIEAAVFLGIPFNRILAVMLGAMQSKGAVQLRPDGQIDVLNVSAGLGHYELSLLDCLGLDGKLGQAKLRQWIQRLVDAVQKKSWDADAEATRQHYSEQFGAVFAAASGRREGEAPAEPSSPAGRGSAGASPSQLTTDDYYPYYFYWSQAHPEAPPVESVPAVFTHETLPEAAGPADDYQSFMASPACYEGCFVHSACHDACHSACHDACHSACHDACHSACHDACHSACVSGDAH